MRYFILDGDKDTWLTSISHNMWKFSDKSRGNWNTLQVGDYVAFYVISPINKIIGYGPNNKKVCK
jgi:hypothetical protein